MAERTVVQVLGPSTGGIRAHVAALRDGLARRGWRVVVAGPHGVLDGLGGVDAEVPVPDRADPRRVLPALRALRPVLAGASLVHAHGLKAGWVASLAGARPMVLTLHNTVLAGQGGRAEPLLRWLERRLPGRADAVIATSAGLADALGATVPPERRFVVPPLGPVTLPRRPAREVRADLAVDPAAALVVGVGRQHRQKGWDVLVDAVPAVVAAEPGVRIVVAGEGPDGPALAAAVEREGLGRWVRLPGPTTDAAGLLAAADVVVVPSRWESGPLVLAEALRLGRAVVATPVGFVPTLVVPGTSGLLVPAEDPVALAGAVVTLLGDPALRARLGRAGAARVVEVLDPARLLDGVEAAYRAALGTG